MNNRTGRLIEQYRKEKGLTQSELAKLLGVSNTAISKWEHGNNLPDITLLEPLSEILGIDKLSLFTSENESKEKIKEKIKNIKKLNIIKNTIPTLIFLLLLIFTNYISYQIYTHKLEKIESTKTEIYRFHSKDSDYIISGYIVLNNDKDIVLFDRSSYQGKRRMLSNSKIKSIELYMYINNKVVLKSSTTNFKEDIKYQSEIIEMLTNSIKYEFTFNEKKINNAKLELICNNKETFSKKIINLEISKEI